MINKDPVFFPCSYCGHKFTTSAMKVHKLSCSHNHDCQCTACQCNRKDESRDVEAESNDPSTTEHLFPFSVSFDIYIYPRMEHGWIHVEGTYTNEKLKFENLETLNNRLWGIPDLYACLILYEPLLRVEDNLPCVNSTDVTEKFKCENIITKCKISSNSHCRVSGKAKPKNHKKPLQDISSKIQNVKNINISENNLVEESHVIDKIVADSKSVTCPGDFPSGSKRKFNYKNSSINLSENSETKLNDPAESTVCKITKLHDRLDHGEEECKHKIFCCVCKDHIFWKSFGVHVLQHCEIQGKKSVTCPVCDKIYFKPTTILTHFALHISDHLRDCSSYHCGNSKYIDHIIDENPFKYCYICCNTFSDHSLYNHMKFHMCSGKI